MNARLLLSIYEMAQDERQQTMLRWTGIADNVALVRVTLLALVKRPAFHVRILAATASNRGSSSARLRRLSDRGIPRYLYGKLTTEHGKAACTTANVSSSQEIGVATHFAGLLARPEAPANKCRISSSQCRSSTLGTVSMIRSSA
jgi:hypothetical protein